MKNITLTATGSGYYRVYVDGDQYSQHTTERIAISSAIQAKSENPDKEVWYDHEYIVTVDGDVEVEEIEEVPDEADEDEADQEEEPEIEDEKPGDEDEEENINTYIENFTQDGLWPDPWEIIIG
jgi:hypothetical protein